MSIKKTILLVEDEALIAMNEAAMLKKHGYEVSTAYNAQKAIETARGKAVDLVLMDIDLGQGKMDGTEVAEIILKEKDIPVVFLSSHTEPKVVEKTEGITSYGYIVKNSGETVMLASIKMAFRLFEANRQIREREEKLKHYIGLIEERNKHLIELYEKMDSPQEDLFDFVLDGSIAITNSSFGFSGFINDDESVMSIFKWSKYAMNNCSVSDKPIEFPIEKAGIWGDCIRERKPIIINDYDSDVRPTKHGTPDGHVHIRRFLSVPVFEGDKIVAIGAVANKDIPYDIADADSLMMLYDKMWGLLKQQRAEKAIKESEEKFRTVYEESPIGKEIYDADGKLVEVNQACLEIFGVSGPEQIKNFNLFVDPNLPNYRKEQLRNKKKIRYEVAFDFNKVRQAALYDTTKSGIIYLDVLITPLTGGKENRARGYLVQVMDITKRKELEVRLKKDKFRFAAILEGTNVGTWEWNIQTGETRFNRKWAEIIGYTLEELSPVSIETWKQFTHPDDFASSAVLLEKHFKGQTAYYQCECRMKHKDGSWIWVLDRGKVATWTDDGSPEWMYGTHLDITERKEQERTLKESEENLRITLKSIGDAVISTDVHGTVVQMNPVAERICGWRKEAARGRKLEEVFTIVNAETRKRVDNPVNKVIKTGEIAGLANHTMLISKDGNEYKIADSAAPIRDDDGNINGVVLVFRDVTEKYEKEKQLKVNKERYKKAQAVARVGSWEYHIETDTFWGSDEGKRIYGFDADFEEFTAEEVMKCVIEKERVNQAMIDLIEKNIPYDIVFDIIPRNAADIKTIHSVAELERDEHGKPVNVIGILQDITEQKKMEEDLKTGKKFFTTIVENIPNMVFLKEAKNFTFYLVNKAAEETIGLKREELIGKNDYDVFPKHEADFFREKDLEAITSGKEVVIQEEELAASDQIRYVYTKKVPIFDEEGNPQYLLGITEDITELKRALEEKDFLMKELNHRVKNNLMMITSLISLKNASLGEAVDLTDVKNQIDAIRIVHEKLYTAENVTQINFREYAEDLLATIFSSFTDRPVQVHTEIQQEILTAKTAIPLGLIVNELATNAIKHGFTDRNEAVFSVDLRRGDTANQYILTISNNGKPFPKDVTLDNPETLGLQLITALVEQLGGAIQLQRDPHPVFTIRFPIEEGIVK